MNNNWNAQRKIALLFYSVLFLLFSTFSNAESLNQQQIDQLISAAPDIIDALQREEKNVSEEQAAIIRDGVFDGKPYHAYSEALKNEPVFTKIEEVVKSNGYTDYIAFANHADRVFSVLISSWWVASAATIGEKDKQIDNLFMYIDSDQIPTEEKEKLIGQLSDMYLKLGANKEDEAIVAKNFDKLNPLFPR